MIMKTLIILLTCFISLLAGDLSLKECIKRTETTTIPFDCTRTVRRSNPGFGFAPEEWGKLPKYLYDDFTMKHKTTFENIGSIFRRFDISASSYELLALRNGVSDPQLGLLATYTREGELIDYIETEVFCYCDKPLYIMQFRIDKDTNTIVTRLHVESPEPIPLYEDFDSIEAQRVDTYYRVDASGKFHQTKQVKFVPAVYTSESLKDEHKNLWEGTETPLQHQTESEL